MLPDTPKPPKHLSTAAKNWWRQIQEEYSIKDAGGLLLLQTSLEAFDQMKAAQKIVAEQGETIKDRFEQIKSHPQTTVIRDARSQMIQGLKALSLDFDLK